MKKDKEPEQLASIALSREEIASRQRVMGKPRMPVSTGQAGAPKLLWVLLIFFPYLLWGFGGAVLSTETAIRYSN